ncbi:MAG: hypothetical protein ACYCT2_03200 [Thermoplasmataceae archaeon]
MTTVHFSQQDFFHWDPVKRSYVCKCGAHNKSAAGRRTHVITRHGEEIGIHVEINHAIPIRKIMDRLMEAFP